MSGWCLGTSFYRVWCHIGSLTGLSGGHFGVVGLILGGLGVHREAFGGLLGCFGGALELFGSI